MSETKIKIRDLHKAFGKKVVLDGVDLDIRKRGVPGCYRRFRNRKIGFD